MREERGADATIHYLGGKPLPDKAPSGDSAKRSLSESFPTDSAELFLESAGKSVVFPLRLFLFEINNSIVSRRRFFGRFAPSA